MTRTIKAKDIKPGMEIEWKHGGYYTRCVVSLVKKEDLSYPAYSIRAVGSAAGWKTFSEGAEVTVLKEAQPEEPTEFGAKVVVLDRRFLRMSEAGFRFHVWHEEGTGDQWAWEGLCAMGPVKVVPGQGWTVPDDDDTLTPEVPDRIEEWPEDDTELRKYTWNSDFNVKWVYLSEHKSWGFIDEKVSRTSSWGLKRPLDGPWTRVDGEWT